MKLIKVANKEKSIADIASGCIWDPSGVDVQFIGWWDNNSEKIIYENQKVV
jgi:hypothetical protein